MAWVGVGLFLLFIAPVRAGVILRWEAEGLRVGLGLMIWGLREQIDLNGGRNEQGKPLLTAAFRGRSISLPKQKKGTALRALRLLLQSNSQDSPVRKAVRITAFDVFLRLGGRDAGALALGAGFLRAVNTLLPFLRLKCEPALNQKTGVYIRCIAEARLGILLMTWITQSIISRRKNQWNIPSEV